MTTPAPAAPVRVERDGDVAVVVLDRPPLNLFDESVFAGFERAVAELTALTAPGRPDRARAVLLEARGRVVSAGVQVETFRDIAEGPDPVGEGTALWARLIRLARTLEDLPVPTVFAAHGLPLTAAFELALACDLIVAAEQASFGLVEIVVGLTPSMGGPQRLAERAGPTRAKELVFGGERYPAARLEQWGVVNRVLPDEGFAEAAREYARLSPRDRRSRTPPPSSSCRPRCATASAPPTRCCPRSPGRCSRARTCAVRWPRSSPTVPDGRPTGVGDSPPGRPGRRPGTARRPAGRVSRPGGLPAPVPAPAAGPR